MIPPLIAISQSELIDFGCPHCGYRTGAMPMQAGGTGVWVCGECKITSCILADGVAKSAIGFDQIYPEFQDHPRRGIPAHGRHDEQPETGGEYFWSRGIGSDYTPGCYICGGGVDLYANISGFVQTREAGERVVAMFATGARMDYRDFEPDRIQVKIGACKDHEKNLANLSSATTTTHTITEAMVCTSQK